MNSPFWALLVERLWVERLWLERSHSINVRDEEFRLFRLPLRVQFRTILAGAIAIVIAEFGPFVAFFADIRLINLEFRGFHLVHQVGPDMLTQLIKPWVG